MIYQITGKITSIFSDDINTDDIIPAWTLHESTEKSFFKQYAFANYDKEFIKRCSQEKYNIIIAGENFGCGSSREQAIYALQENNVTTVIAKSFPDIFYRNALNNGLVLISLNDISSFKLDDKMTIDLQKKTIKYKDKVIRFHISDEDILTFCLGGKIGKVKDHHKQLSTTNQKYIYHYVNARIKSVKAQTIVEKIISDHVNQTVLAGEKIESLSIDILFFNEVIGPPAIKEFKTHFPNTKVFNREKVFFIPDHAVPSSSIAVSEGITFIEKFAKEQGVKCYKEGDGIEHVVLIEDGYIVPGEIVLGTDSHTDTNGALNTLAFGVGTTDATYALATGYLYDFEVPNTIRINLEGKFKKGVYAKDLILYLIGQLGVDGASKRVIEFGGPALLYLTMDARTTIANMAVEMGARSAIFEFDEILDNYLKKRAKFPYKGYLPDKKCHYEIELSIDLSILEPCIAFPHKPSNVTFISAVTSFLKKSQKSKTSDFAKVTSLVVTDAFLGACTNGRYEDFIEAAKILKGKKIHRDVTFVAIPASRKIYNRLLEEGILQIFVEAGINIESANCGPCFGKHMGILGKDAQMISSSNRNYIGRMGSKEAKIFLASPATVAASAIEGKITDPRKYL